MPALPHHPSAALQLYTLSYAPAFMPHGVAISPTASRHELAERQTTQVKAKNADSAVAEFERDARRMVTSCCRARGEGVLA